MGKKITLRELSSILNLSISTVSKSLSNSPEISDPTKKIVQDAARKYKYRPNPIARSLKNKSTKTIGVIIPNILANFFSKVLFGMEEEAGKNGYNLITCLSNESTAKEKESLKMLSEVGVDAVLISAALETQLNKNFRHIKELQYYDVPVIMFDRVNKELATDIIAINDNRGAYDATSFLYRTGCKQIAFINTLKETSIGQDREKGYVQAIEFLGADKAHIFQIKLDHLALELPKFIRQNQIDGIIAVDELTAIYVMNIVRSMGLSIPDDVSIIGFTDGILAQNYFPSLTTVSQKAEILGKEAIKITIDRIKKGIDAPPTVKILDTSLIIRNSTKTGKA